MAEGLLRHDAGDRFEVFSARTKPSPVRPEAIAVYGRTMLFCTICQRTVFSSSLATWKPVLAAGTPQ